MLATGASLGINTPLQTITQAQNDRFLRNQRNIGEGENPGRVIAPSLPTYVTATRGVLAEKGQESNSKRILIFQFNPDTITDSKGNNYNSKSYTGFTFNDHVWGSGGARNVNFKLNFEASPAFNTPYFGNNPTYGNSQHETILNENRFPRGTLDMVELLQSFTYPSQEDANAPRFANGGFIPSPKFMPPPIVVFSYGNYYLEGLISDITINHTQFNKDLLPERSDAEVSFRVLEQHQIKYKPIQGATTFRDSSPNAGEPTPIPNNVA